LIPLKENGNLADLISIVAPFKTNFATVDLPLRQADNNFYGFLVGIEVSLFAQLTFSILNLK
jgi:hypothetical protein